MSRETKMKEFRELGEKEQFMIDCFASYWSPARVSKAIIDRYGESEELKLKSILAFKLRNEKLIIKRRKELADEVPIINPTARFKMAQDIYDLAMGGIEKMFAGKIYKSFDLKNAVGALTLANNMSQSKDSGTIPDDDIIRKVVQETFEELKAGNPKMSPAEIANLMLNSMSENAVPYIEELELVN